jgi:hypothetical protein
MVKCRPIGQRILRLTAKSDRINAQESRLYPAWMHIDPVANGHGRAAGGGPEAFGDGGAHVSGSGRGFGERAGDQGLGGSRRGANRSPCWATRSSTVSAVKNRSWGWRQDATSSQLTGVETVGNWRARSE